MTEQTDSKTTSQAREKAYLAVMDVITDSVAQIRASDYGLTSHTGQIRDLAMAFRLMAGGPQPGSVEVSAK